MLISLHQLSTSARRCIALLISAHTYAGPASDSSSESSQATGSQKSSDDGSSSGDSQALYAGMQAALQGQAHRFRPGLPVQLASLALCKYS